jgi:hypothetical protein
MAYSTKARELRRCVATTKHGERCRSFALWDHPGGLCASHGRHHRGPLPGPGEPFAPRKRTNYIPCRCQGYNWPHRPGSGRYCLWPDPPPAQCPTPAHTTRTPRSKRNAHQRLERFLRRAGS